ncbi:MAG: LLM class flavin-dependent oxidoreductase [Mycobacterium sp.]
MSRNQTKVGVGCYVDPITPLWSLRANIMLARFLGAEDVWFGDHAKSMFPSTAWGPHLSAFARWIPTLDAFLDPTVTIAKYARRGGPRMGTSVTDAVRRTPADLARVWMSLHHLTRGRAVLGIGAGEIENTEPFGLELEPSVSRLEDTVVAVRAAWASSGAPLTHDGRFHKWHNATFALPQWRGTIPPIWVAGQGPRTCRLAGRHGDGWIYILNAGIDAWHGAAKNMAEGARAAGMNPEAVTRSAYFAPLLGRSGAAAVELSRQPMVQAMVLTLPATAWAAAGAEHPLGSDFKGFSDLDPAVLEADNLARHGAAITPDVLGKLIPCGTAEDVFAKLEPLIDEGLNHVIIYSAAAALKPRLAAGHLYEQRRLIRMLQGTTAGTFDP